jgi:hypothetical protein
MAEFSAEDLDRIARTDEVQIETSRDGGETRRTTIWIMVADGNVYVRSVRGPDGQWYRSISRSGRGRLIVDGTSWAISVQPVGDAAEIERVSEAIRRKYEARWAGPTAAMLRPGVLGTTLRVQRADSA